MRFLFLCNPAAARGRAAGVAGRLPAALRRLDLDADLRTTEGPGHAHALAREQSQDYDVVVAVGGDGTVHEVGGGLIAAGGAEARAALAVLPCGSGNDFARMLQQPRRLTDLLEAWTRSPVHPVDHGRVRWQEDGRQGSCAFLNAVGVGFDALVAHTTTHVKVLPGLLGYVHAVLRSLALWEAPSVRVEVEAGPLYDGPLLLVTAGNGVSSGGGFRLTPDASIVDGQLAVCLAPHMPLGRIVRLMPRVLRGRHLGAPGILAHQTTRLRLESAGPMPVHADGEAVTRAARRVEVEVVPGGLRVLAPGVR